MPIDELVADRKGARVAPAQSPTAKPTILVAAGSIKMTSVTAATFASQLSYALATPVEDKTGLSGLFDFALTWTPAPGEDGGPATSGLPPTLQAPPSPQGNAPPIFTAIGEQLGLRLKPGHGNQPVVVIDHVQVPAAD